jgi:hypothetical protein
MQPAQPPALGATPEKAFDHLRVVQKLTDQPLLPRKNDALMVTGAGPP